MRTRSHLSSGALVFALFAATLSSAAPQAPDPAVAISKTISKLRSMPDDQRAVATKETALAIRALDKGKMKVGLASSLSNLATEGDFGRETLQEVTTTLALSLAETPQPTEKGVPFYAYSTLAQLKKYEGMTVPLKCPELSEAVNQLNELDAKRAKVDFTLTDLSGKQWTRSSLKGKVVLVNFWATWCPPCRKEMPDLDALYKELGPNGFVILAISDEKDETVRKFISDKGYSYTILLDPGRAVNTAYGVEGIPKSFLYDRRGRMIAQTIDMRTRGQFLALLAKAGLKE